MNERFQTTDVDLAAYLCSLGHKCNSVVYDEQRYLGTFEFMRSPGIEKQANRWLSGGEEGLKKFAFERVRLYRWARDVVRAHRG